MGVRDQGFGLNFNQGFGSRFMAAAPQSGAAQNSAWDMLGQKRQQEFTGGQNDANRGLQRYLGDQSNATQMHGIDAQAATARQGNMLQYKASILPANLRQSRFRTLLPYLDQAMSGMGQGLNGGYGGAGQRGEQPEINAAPVLTANQMQQQVNAQRAGNDASMAGRVQQMNAGLAGRGFGSNSPLAQALMANFAGQNMATNTANERETRLSGAQMNSEHVLKAQQAREQQFASRQQEEIERGKAYTGGISSLMSALGAFGQ